MFRRPRVRYGSYYLVVVSLLLKCLFSNRTTGFSDLLKPRGGLILYYSLDHENSFNLYEDIKSCMIIMWSIVGFQTDCGHFGKRLRSVWETTTETLATRFVQLPVKRG